MSTHYYTPGILGASLRRLAARGKRSISWEDTRIVSLGWGRSVLKAYEQPNAVGAEGWMV